LIDDNHQHKEGIKNISFNIGSINSIFEILKDQCSHIKDLQEQCSYIKYLKEHFLGRSQNPSSYEQPFYQDDHDSSHYQGPHTTHFSRDLLPPRIEVNKFHGSDPTRWITQIEHYLSLHGITDDLSKLHYGILHLYPERWKWWQWRKKACQGYLAST
jgi:hypothetical protein